MKTNHTTQEFISLKGSSKKINCSLRAIAAVLMIIINCNWFHAQTESYTRPSWWFGVVGAANVNFYGGSTQKLNESYTPPVPFHKGLGLGLFGALAIEYYKPGKVFGGMLQLGYDSRKGTFDDVVSPCNCPGELKTKLSYFSIEPSIRIAPFKSNLFFYAGPRIAFNVDHSFVYQLRTNPDYPAQVQGPEVKGNFSDMQSTLISMQVGAGYDVFLRSREHRTQAVLSPFISFHPYFGQDPRTVETWSMTTIRAGAALKFGQGRKIIQPGTEDPLDETPIATPIYRDSMVELAVNSPKNEPVEGTIREIFPLRNYVFFEPGSTKIADRYVLLKKDEVADFNEFEPEVYATNELAGRSERQMLVYYNILNIIGDRMVNYPSSKITLVGSSEKGKEDGIKMAASIKTYLVTVFEIDANRIDLKGQIKPTYPTEGGVVVGAIPRLEGDRRVSIETKSPELLLSFKTGEESVLKPVVVSSRQTAPLNSYVTFKVAESEIPIANWKLKLTDSTGRTQTFGPFETASEQIAGDKILGDANQGTYDVQMVATLEDGQIVKQDTTIRVIKWQPEINQKASRYSIIFDYNQALVIPIYVNYLKTEIVPKIPMGGTISIQGYADAIGDAEYNQKLSLARAKNVEKILRKELNKNGRNDVTIQVVGFGEDLKNAQFDNKFPEERYYNRSVIIDITPQK